ncbi:MAG: DNA translocase FtsK [Clostridia bacterium]|nr:DNA translocase FtsK [Clostridia bacterium]
MDNEFKKPTIDLLEDTKPAVIEDDSKEIGEKIVDVLKEINISCIIKSIKRGKSYTSYTCSIKMPSKLENKKDGGKNNDNPLSILKSFEDYIENRTDLVDGITFIIPKKGDEVEIQVVNRNRAHSNLKEKLASKEFQDAPKYSLYIGEDVEGNPHIIDAIKMPHMIMGGYTGSGKSTEIASILLSLMLKCTPRDVRFLLVDRRQCDFETYNESPYSLTRAVIKDEDEFYRALDWIMEEANRRISLFSIYSAKDIEQYNEKWHACMEYLPRIFIVMDEMIDFAYDYDGEIKLKEYINKIVSLSETTGIHFIVATQRPNLLKSDIDVSFPTKISFRMDGISFKGEDPSKLGGSGDMYFTDWKEQKRLQGPYVTNEEINRVLSYVKSENDAIFDPILEKRIHPKTDLAFDLGKNVLSDDIKEAIRISIGDDVESGWLSISRLQRLCGWGWPKAAKVFDQLRELHIYSDKDKFGRITLIISNEEAKRLCGKKNNIKIYTLSRDMIQALTLAQTCEDGIINNIKIQLGFGWKSTRALDVLKLLKTLPVFAYVDEDVLRIVGTKKEIQDIIDQAIIQ